MTVLDLMKKLSVCPGDMEVRIGVQSDEGFHTREQLAVHTARNMTSCCPKGVEIAWITGVKDIG